MARGEGGVTTDMALFLTSCGGTLLPAIVLTLVALIGDDR